MALVTRLLCGHAVELIAGLPVLLLLATPVVVHAQNGEAVAREARKITVRLEGATQGSGVLVNRQGNQYTVLTAWHVVADQRPGEEMAIITPDGSQHPLDQGSVRRVGIVDMAVLTFTSISNYNVVNLGDPTSVALGGTVYVSGYPLADQAIPIRNLSFTKGDIVSNGAADTIHSNRLLYRNPTLPGMSGGAILNAQGELIGIHLNAVRADQISDSSGKAVAIQINQGLAIDAYTQSTASTTAQAVATQPAVSSVRPATGWPETAAPPLPLAPSLTSLTPRRSPAPPARMSQSLMERYQEAVEAQRLFIKSLTGR